MMETITSDGYTALLCKILGLKVKEVKKNGFLCWKIKVKKDDVKRLKSFVKYVKS